VFETDYWREGRADRDFIWEQMAECEGVWEKVPGGRRGQILTVFGTGCWKEERAGCDSVWKQVAGERRGESVNVFGNWLLAR